MMTKARKKIASFFVAAALLFPMCVASVSAANTTDINWTMTSSSTDFKYLGACRAKQDSSAVFFKMKTSVTSNKVDVKVLVTNAYSVTSWDQVLNCTVKSGIARNYAKCTKGLNYSLHNTVYEDYFPRVTIAMTTAKNEYITGVWSADSSGTWNEATYY